MTTNPPSLTLPSSAAPLTPNNLDAAVNLGRAGYRVFPLPQGMKAAKLEDWPTLATSDSARIATWWTAQPDANVAIVGGQGLLILDVDVRKGGDASLAAIEAKHGALPATLTARTPSGGRHLYFGGPDVANSSGKLGAGLDIKSRAGYVVAPPSVTIEVPGKQHAGVYEWVNMSVGPTQAPQWLLDLAGAAKTREAATAPAFKLRDATPEQWSDIASALDYLTTVPAVAGNQLWSDIGYSLLCLGDEGERLWCEWSARAPGYNIGAPEQWWAGHSDDCARSDFRALFTIAQRYGWVNPRSRAAQPVVPPPPSVPAGTLSRFTPVDAWTYADGPDPRWRIDGLLPEQGLAMIFGASGSGKSFFTLDLAMAIARGVAYGHDQRAVLAGRVVYIVSEGAGGFRKRLRAYRTRHQLAPGSPCARLITVAPNFMDAGDATELQAAILAAGGADVVVIDTLHASVSGADENSARDMGVVLGHCRALHVATGGLVILIHHSGKDEERGARGSSAIRAAMDTEIEVSGGGGEFCVAHVTKQRDGDTSGTVFFKLTNVALFGDRPGSSPAVEHIPPPEKVRERKSRVSEEQAFAVQQVQLMMSSGLYTDGVQLDVLKQAMQSQRPDKRPDSIRRSIERAVEGGLLIYGVDQKLRTPTVGAP
jgi:hypothetical protein